MSDSGFQSTGQDLSIPWRGDSEEDLSIPEPSISNIVIEEVGPSASRQEPEPDVDDSILLERRDDSENDDGSYLDQGYEAPYEIMGVDDYDMEDEYFSMPDELPDEEDDILVDDIDAPDAEEVVVDDAEMFEPDDAEAAPPGAVVPEEDDEPSMDDEESDYEDFPIEPEEIDNEVDVESVESPTEDEAVVVSDSEPAEEVDEEDDADIETVEGEDYSAIDIEHRRRDQDVTGVQDELPEEDAEGSSFAGVYRFRGQRYTLSGSQQPFWYHDENVGSGSWSASPIPDSAPSGQYWRITSSCVPDEPILC